MERHLDSPSQSNRPSFSRYIETPEPWVMELKGIIRQMNVDIDVAIVEGPRDECGLRKAGFEPTIKTVGTATNLLDFADSIDAENIVILTDYDQEGKRLHAMLRERIPASRCKGEYRREVGRVLTAHRRYDIESLNNLFEIVL